MGRFTSHDPVSRAGAEAHPREQRRDSSQFERVLQVDEGRRHTLDIRLERAP
jgi:hypothetical protein